LNNKLGQTLNEKKFVQRLLTRYHWKWTSKKGTP